MTGAPQKLALTRALVVEGRYDAARLANLVTGTVLTTDGFAVFKDKEMQALLKRVGAAQGLLILTDPDAAGFKIRHFVAQLAGAENVLHAYVPALPGKERRKPAPGREGLLGVEGVPDAVLRRALLDALKGEDAAPPAPGRAPITYADLYDWGLSGTADARARRTAFLQALGLPPHLGKKALLQVLNTLYTREALAAQLAPERQNAPPAEG